MHFNFGFAQTIRRERKTRAFSIVPFAPDPDFVDRPEIVATKAWFEEAYRDTADRLELPGRNDLKANVLRLVSDWLQDETNGWWVMVIDNVDRVETSRRVSVSETKQTPSRNGTILVTSRSKDVAARLAGDYNKTNEVLAMNEGEGLQLLHHKLHDPPIEESAMELLRAREAAYINRHSHITVASYVKEFRRNNKKRQSLPNWDAGELRRDEIASNSVVTTWQILFEQIRQERRSAVELLSLMSFFNPQGIPESTLRR
ncbi:hypothetical protein J4E91_010796 [Alternaria rosae]|nr:hypothetical protein J4E91_010796 [Alternaria rosae]